MPTPRPAWPIRFVGRCPVSLRALFLVTFSLLLVGCSDGKPFAIVPVSGKVKTPQPVAADRIIVTFIPQGVDAQNKGKTVAAAAQGEVDPKTGDFTSLTTLTGGDGAVVGKHKVTVVAVKNSPTGVPVPVPTIPVRYQNAKTTPLEFEVKASGANFAELAIEAK
jgi:hypothetical protein